MQATNTTSIIAIRTIMQKNNFSLADIHTHILPGIDDGADSIETAIELLYEEQKQGVTDIVLTPHFNIQDTTIQEFLSKREESFKLLSKEMEKHPDLSGLNLHLGAEVKHNPNLIYSDVFDLCIKDTSYLLLELTMSHPFNFEQTVLWMLSKGISPILAHVERYDYICKNPKLLENLLYAGVVFQCNASSLFSRHYGKRVKKLIKHGYVHVLASDTHNMKSRPPELVNGLDKCSKYADALISNSMKIINNKLI